MTRRILEHVRSHCVSEVLTKVKRIKSTDTADGKRDLAQITVIGGTFPAGISSVTPTVRYALLKVKDDAT